jgi:hypothetical protein
MSDNWRARFQANLTDQELSALIEACNVTNRHPHEARPPYGEAGNDARLKLVEEERRRGEAAGTT